MWKANEAYPIDTMLRQYETVLGIQQKKKYFRNDVKPHVWASHFDELLSSSTESGIVYEAQILEPQHTEELNSDFTR